LHVYSSGPTRVLDRQWTDTAVAARGIEWAAQWWDALATERAFVLLLAEPAARFASKQRQESPPGFGVHLAAPPDAGFYEVAAIWQKLSDRVLLAVRQASREVSGAGERIRYYRKAAQPDSTDSLRREPGRA